VALGKLPWGLRTEGKNMKKKAVIIDVDKTLVTDTAFDNDRCHSFEYLKEWHKETLKARELEVGVKLVAILHQMGFKLVIMTARDVTGREELMMKLRELGIARLFDKVLMRESIDNGKPSDYVKGKMIDAVEHEYDFRFALDDANHGLYVSRGIKVFNANNWNEEEK